MNSTVKALLAGSALTCLAVVGATGTAHAATGRLTLIGGTGSRTVVYDACQPSMQFRPQPLQLEAFENQPLPGCQAVLFNRTGASKVLCVGRGTVPVEFRESMLVRIQLGTAPVCT
ncbi:hypothetical protein [Nonomuraea sp. NPDC049480]|uniref:hypothetical protein n=1 Tax=Nonomuraea sp. NPDC049480 TaxID=3364353 RepID=UPI0037A67208